MRTRPSGRRLSAAIFWIVSSFEMPHHCVDADTKHSLNACMSACSSQSGVCVGVSWVPGQNGKCYLKNLSGIPAASNAAVWGARIATNATIFPNITVDTATCANSFFIGSSGCGSPLPAGVVRNQLTSQQTMTTRDGRQRTYYYYIPTTYDPTKPSKMLISFHGQGGNGVQQAGDTQFTVSTINTNYIAIFPDGTIDPAKNDNSRHWQGATYQTPGVDDVSFTQQLIGLMSNTFCVDPARIYATGHSNGGGFVGTLACDPSASRLFAAFGANSGAFYTAPGFANPAPSSCFPDSVYNVCNPGRSRLPFLELHGDADGQIAYGGGSHQFNCMPAIPQYISQWAVREGFYPNNTYNDTQLIGMATTTNLLNSSGLTMAIQYQWGTSGVGLFGNPGGTVGEVTHVRIPGWGHAWPQGGSTSSGFSAAPYMLNYLSQWNLFTA
jgi:poly(3-hydroxybutyrate) depolymerase